MHKNEEALRHAMTVWTKRFNELVATDHERAFHYADNAAKKLGAAASSIEGGDIPRHLVGIDYPTIRLFEDDWRTRAMKVRPTMAGFANGLLTNIAAAQRGEAA